MGLFGNRDKDDLEKKSKKAKQVEEEDEEEEDDDTESSNCSVRINTVNDDDGVFDLDELSDEGQKSLISELKTAMKDNNVVDLSNYGMAGCINGKYIVSFTWNNEDD